MFSLYLWYFIITKVHAICIIGMYVSLVLLATAVIMYSVIQSVYPKEFEKMYSFKWARKCLYASIPLAIIFTLATVMIPKGNEFLILVSTKYADEYLQTHPDSNFNPVKTIESIDEGITKVFKKLNTIDAIVDKGLMKLEKKVQ